MYTMIALKCAHDGNHSIQTWWLPHHNLLLLMLFILIWIIKKNIKHILVYITCEKKCYYSIQNNDAFVCMFAYKKENNCNFFYESL